MYAIVLICLTLVLAVVLYKQNQCSGFRDLITAFFISMLIWIGFFTFIGLLSSLYVLKPL